MFHTPSNGPKRVSEEEAAKLQTEHPITSKGAEVSVTTVRRVVLTILHEHGVDISTVDRDALLDHVTLILTAGATSGAMATYESIQQAHTALKGSPMLKLVGALSGDSDFGLDVGMGAIVEIARKNSLDFAQELRGQAKAFIAKHPLPTDAEPKED